VILIDGNDKILLTCVVVCSTVGWSMYSYNWRERFA